jgi:phosphopantothenoylcysteine decarboxylase/phosphopantothenate--cysteine ligase
MSEPEELAKAVCAVLSTPRDLQGRRVLVTAGPTHEPMDPVRVVGNRSSGRMGFALAERARDRGATVTLVTGPVSLPDPPGVRTVRVRTARELFDATVPEAPHHDIVVMAAAVADYRPANVAPEKIKKTQGKLVLRLVRNPDILAELGARRRDLPLPVLVGFAVESTDLVTYAREKLARKRCDLVVANLAEHGFEGADNLVTLVRRDTEEALPRLPKTAVADRILDAALELLVARHGT